MATPGQKLEVEKLKVDNPLSADEHTVFRAIAARANYLSQDRIDLRADATAAVPRRGVARRGIAEVAVQ